MPTVPDAHMCSVRALSALGLMPSASAASEEMWLWNAVRSGMTEPTTRPSRSFGLTAGTESKQALPASQMRSRYDALRTPNFETPAPTSATFLMAVLPSRGLRQGVRRLGQRAELVVGAVVVQPPLALAVDPRRRDAQRSRRLHIVEIALGHVQPRRRRDPLARGQEMSRRRLVGADLLGGDDEVEVDGQVAARAGQQIVVDVRENREPVAGGPQPAERIIGVGERRPRRQALRQERLAPGCELQAQPLGDAAGGDGE